MSLRLYDFFQFIFYLFFFSYLKSILIKKKSFFENFCWGFFSKRRYKSNTIKWTKLIWDHFPFWHKDEIENDAEKFGRGFEKWICARNQWKCYLVLPLSLSWDPFRSAVETKWTSISFCSRASVSVQFDPVRRTFTVFFFAGSSL